MSRLEQNRMEAYAHQLKEDSELLLRFAAAADKRGFEKTLSKVEATIAAYRSKLMRKLSDRFWKKHAAQLDRFKKESS